MSASNPSPVFIHPTAIIDEGAQIGAGSKIWHWVHVCGGARIGQNCSLGQNVFVSNGAVLGNNVKLQNNVSVYDGVTLEDDVLCGPSMVFTNVINPRSHISRKHEYQTTRVRRGASIGANATIVCGIEIGRYAFIGAGATVTRDVPDFALMAGVPSRRIGWVCQCGVKLPQPDADGHANCPACQDAYLIGNEHCTRL